MSKVASVLFVVFAVLTVRAMKGGQILDQPLPYTVYILTGDKDDVFYMREQRRKDIMKYKASTERSSTVIEEYRTTAVDDGSSKEPIESNDPVDKLGIHGEYKRNVSRRIPPGDSQGAEGKTTESSSGKIAPVASQNVDGERRPEINSENVHAEISGQERVAKKFISDAEHSADVLKEDGSHKDEVFQYSTPPKSFTSGITNDSSVSGEAPDESNHNISKGGTIASEGVQVALVGDGSNKSISNQAAASSSIASGKSISGDGTSAGDSETATQDADVTGDSPKAVPQRHTQYHYHVNTSKPSPPHCKLAASTTAVPTTLKPPRPQTLWRLCMGVVFDERIILTGSICFARDEGLHFFTSINATNMEEAQEVTKVSTGRTLFDFRVIRLNENQSMPGEVADWQDEDSVYSGLEAMSNASRTGIVPSFGYPPKVAALKLLPLVTCRRIYDELMEAYPAETSTLPAFLIDTVACATQADKPVEFPDGSGLVQPGLACPDSLGAPFILGDGTVLGVLVAADCRLKNVAFFQTLGKGIPEDEDEETD